MILKLNNTITSSLMGAGSGKEMKLRARVSAFWRRSISILGENKEEIRVEMALRIWCGGKLKHLFFL